MIRKQMTCRCGHRQFEEKPQASKIPPHILYFDIETAPFRIVSERFDLRLHSGYLDWHDIAEPFYVICWAAAWYDKPEKIYSGAVTDQEAKKRKDKRHLQDLWTLLDNADYVVGHNAKGFDIKKVETRFILNHMPAPADFLVRDTLLMARKRFKPESQALDYWSSLFGGQRKLKMCFEDWVNVNKGDQMTINKMVRYNKGDVRDGIIILKRFVDYCESNTNKKVFP